MAAARAYEEVVDFIAAGSSTQQVADFRPSPDTQARVRFLVEREKDAALTAAESAELQSYLQLEHMMRLAKARARQRLGSDRAEA